MIVCRGIRGATTCEANTRESIFAATAELFQEMVSANRVTEDHVAAVFFTTTQDLDAAFPATAVREMGWDHTALMCGREIAVPGSTGMCIRILLLVNIEKTLDLVNVYLNGAVHLKAEASQP
jgi:chorismate mutase